MLRERTSLHSSTARISPQTKAVKGTLAASTGGMKSSTIRDNPTDITTLISRVSQIEQRLFANEGRLQKIERGKHDQAGWGRSAEILRKQVQDSVEVEERFLNIEQMLSQLGESKADRSQVSTQAQPSLAELYDKQREQGEAVEVLRSRLHSVVSKVQLCIRGLTEQYQQFVEKNLVASAQYASELGQNTKKELVYCQQGQSQLWQKVEQLASKLQQSAQLNDKEQQTSNKLHDILTHPCLSGLRLAIRVEAHKQPSWANHKTVGSGSWVSHSMSSLYEPIQSSRSKIDLCQRIYKLDSNYYLLDERENFILDDSNSPIRLAPDHIQKLREHGMI